MTDTDQIVIDSMARRIKELEKKLATKDKALSHQCNINTVFNDYTKDLVLTSTNDIGTDIYSDFDIYINEQLRLVEGTPQCEFIIDAALSFFGYNLENLEGEDVGSMTISLLKRMTTKYEAAKKDLQIKDGGVGGQVSAGELTNPEEAAVAVDDASIINKALVEAVKQANNEADKYYDKYEKLNDRVDLQLRFIGSNLSLQDTAVIDHLVASIRAEFDSIRKTDLDNHDKISALRGLCWMLGDSVSDAADTIYLEQEMMKIYGENVDIDQNFKNKVAAVSKKKAKR